MLLLGEVAIPATEQMVRDLAFTWHPQSPDAVDDYPRSRAFHTALCTAKLGELRIGHLRASWCPAALVETVFPSPTAWVAKSRGWCHRSDDPDRLWLAVASWRLPPRLTGRVPPVRQYRLDAGDVPDPATRDADLAEMDAWFVTEFRRWRRYHSLPMVAHVRVDGGDATGWDWRRRGVATAMYATAAGALAADDLVLRASGLQSDDAQGLWASFRDSGLTSTVRLPEPNPKTRPATRTFEVLDFRKWGPRSRTGPPRADS